MHAVTKKVVPVCSTNYPVATMFVWIEASHIAITVYPRMISWTNE